MSNKLVSVIIPTYKRSEDVLLKAVNSVLTQSYVNLEVIVVDDSPETYEKRNKIKKRIEEIEDNRVRYIQMETNQGACAARNRGIDSCNGEIIGFLDDDDEWLQDKLKLQVEEMENNDVGLVYCSYNVIRCENGEKIVKYNNGAKKTGYIHDDLQLYNYIGSTSFVIIKKEVIDKCGVFNNDIKSAQDYDFWLRISKEYKVGYVEKPLVNYHAHDGQRISTNPDNKIQGLEKIIEINSEYIKTHPRIYTLRVIGILPYYFLKNGYIFSMKKWFNALIRYPFEPKLISSFLMLQKKFFMRIIGKSK